MPLPLLGDPANRAPRCAALRNPRILTQPMHPAGPPRPCIRAVHRLIRAEVRTPLRIFSRDRRPVSNAARQTGRSFPSSWILRSSPSTSWPRRHFLPNARHAEAALSRRYALAAGRLATRHACMRESPYRGAQPHLRTPTDLLRAVPPTDARSNPGSTSVRPQVPDSSGEPPKCESGQSGVMFALLTHAAPEVPHLGRR